MRFVVEDGHLLVFADLDELAPGIDPGLVSGREVQVMAVPLERGTNNEQVVEPMAQGIASVLEAGWQSPSAKVRDVVVVTEHPAGAYSWLSLLRTGACEGTNILDATLDMGVHFIMNHEDQERHLGSWEYQAISSEDGFVLEVCQALLENIDVPPLFADSDLLQEDGEDGDPAGRPSWQDYEERYAMSTQELMQRIAAGEAEARSQAEWEAWTDWMWSYDDYLREQWRRTVVDHLSAELSKLRRRLEDLEAERQRAGDAIARLEEQGARFTEDG
ncbi:MAG: hypothetical protein H0Z37_00235 [Firmicutes bacterium]|nr:hypothetical protein [Bacillota bacterium]